MYTQTKIVPGTIAFILFFMCTASAQISSGKEVSKENVAGKPGAARWELQDVDAVSPPVEPDVPCPLEAVLTSAADRAKELVNTLPRFAATEVVEHYEADSPGNWGNPQTVKFDYAVEMRQTRPDMLVMEETRDGWKSLERFPAHLATTGLPVVAMVFHPIFSGDHEFKCEGLSSWDGRRAWQVHFHQRPDKPRRLRGYRIKEMAWGLKLKGRAWIDALTFQVLHIDTDLMEPVLAIPLLREHFSIDYRPVRFKKENEELWLQQMAEVYMDYRGHRYRRRHTFTNFLLFSVDVDTKDKPPAATQN